MGAGTTAAGNDARSHEILAPASSTDDECPAHEAHDLGSISGAVRRRGSLQDGDCLYAAFDDDEQWADVFSFSLRRPMRVQVDLTSSDLDPVLVLLGPGGDRIEHNDDGGAGADARIVRDLSPGRYVLIATQYAREVGPYRLVVRGETLGPASAPGDPCTAHAVGYSVTLWDGACVREVILGNQWMDVFLPGR